MAAHLKMTGVTDWHLNSIIWLPDDFLILTFVAESEDTKIFHVYTDSDTNGQFLLFETNYLLIQGWRKQGAIA